METREATFTSWDGEKLFYRAWLPAGGAKRAVLLFHRGHEHSGRFASFVNELALEGVAFFAWDARGNGMSPGPRDDVEHFGVYAKDADCFARHVASEHGIDTANTAVVASSVGALVAATWVHDYAPPIRAQVLAAPAFRIKLYVPLAIPLLRLAMKLGVMERVQSYVKSRVLTHDPQERQRLDDDPLITHSISTRVLVDAHDTATRLLRDAGAIRVPTLVLTAGSDWVVSTRPQRRFLDGLGTEEKRQVTLPGSYHAIFFERDRERALRVTREFLTLHFAGEPARPPLVHADLGSRSRQVHDRLAAGRRSLSGAVSRLFLKTVGRLSDGIALGWKSGFDSGVTLDYVYRNEPRGATPLGRFIDRQYLNSPGWSGIRQRRRNLERLLRRAIDLVRKNGASVHIVDVAAGPGRYILETLRDLNDASITALLRDYQEVNLDAGRRLASELGLDGAVRYEAGDAFSKDELSNLSPRPALAIVSGLFELFPENAGPRATLSGLAAAMEPGSCLLYTNQPWHPQLEFIARVLTNREGRPWIMRSRSSVPWRSRTAWRS